MTPRRSPSASPQDIEFLAKVAAYWKSKDSQAASPTQFGRFVIKETLGQGGFGIVYRAFDPLLGRDVAIKVPGLQSLADESRLKRFLAEARHLGSLSHPNIAEIYEANEVDGLCYLAMKYYPEGTLATWVKALPSRLELHLIARIFEGVVQGVAAAHSIGLVHRDLKPSNILISTTANPASSSFIPCVADFGLAKIHGLEDPSYSLTNCSRLGTVQYMAPEQFTLEPSTSPASDVYALGVILFELLIGRTPELNSSDFTESTREGLCVVAHDQKLQAEMQNLASIRPDVPLALLHAVEKCLRFNPNQRYRDANALLLELRGAGTAIPATRIRPVTSNRNMLRLGVWGALGCALLGITTFSLNKDAPRFPAVAEAEVHQVAKQAYAQEIQSTFKNIKSDSSSVRRQSVGKALKYLSSTSIPFEAAYLNSLGDTNREFSLNFGSPHWTSNATVSKDGKWLAVNGPNQDIVLYNLEQPKLVRRYFGIQDDAFRIAISPNNTFVIGINSIYNRPDRTLPQVLLWDFDTGNLLSDLNDQIGLVDVRTLEFLSENQVLVSGAFLDGHHAKVFSIGDRVVEQSVSMFQPPEDHSVKYENLRFQVTEKARAEAEAPGIFVVDKLDQRTTSCQLTHDAVAVSLSPNGLIAFVDSPIDCSNVTDPHTVLVQSQIVVWDPKAQSELFRQVRNESSAISAITFAPDEKSIYFIDMAGMVYQRSLKKDSLESSSTGLAPKEIWCVSIHPTDPKILYCGDGGWVSLQDIETEGMARQATQRTSTSPWSLHGNMLVTQCAWRPGNKDQFATSSFDGTVRIWQLTNDAPKMLAEFPHPVRVRCIVFTPDGARIATGCDDQQIRIFEVETRQLISTLSGHKSKVRSLSYAVDGRRLFSSANDASVITWDLGTGKSCNVEHLSTNSMCSSVSPDGKWFVFGTEAGILGIRSLTGEGESKDISVSKQWLRCLAITTDSQTLATGTQDGEIALWNMETGIKLAELSKQPSPIMSLSFSPDNRTLTAGLYSGHLIAWNAFTDLLENTPRQFRD